MSILIKGMDKPDCCGLCPLFDDKHPDPQWCMALHKHIDVGVFMEYPDCPIIEMPQHGNLIEWLKEEKN